LAVGFDLETAARLSNAAAGVVVGKRATATCSLAELEAAYIDVRNVQKKPIVGFTNGCFDLFHAGHKHFLKECQKWCDQLVVMVNTDDSVRQLKGPGRPVQQAKFRLFNVRTELRPSDSTWLFETTEGLIQSIAAHKPDVIFKGMEYETKDVVGADLARVILVPMLPGYSTTSEIAKRA
jgi:D-beta-D-heptose 7-phosphate kinase/D-beta-D-heptose 1-phosphate adenosyltransferase